MKYLLYISVMFFVMSAEDRSDKDGCFDYPKRIDELNSRDLYDSARWILFNWLGPKELDGVYYGQMELRYKNVLSRNDTMEIFFQFYGPDTSSMKKTTSNLIARASVAFRQNTKKRLWAFVYPLEGFSADIESGDKFLEFPPSDTAIKFLKSRRNIINECYLQFARKKQILD